MKNIRKIFLGLIAVLSLSFSIVTYAAEAPTSDFEFSSDSLGREVIERINAGETDFEITKEITTSDPDLGNEISISVWITKKTEVSRAATATDTINWALSGRYYYKSNDETVSNYGNHGSVDYTGSSLKNAQWDVYHDVTYKYQDKFTATATDSEISVTNGKKYIGKYELKNKSTGKYSESAGIYIIVKKDGKWETKGNYGAIHID